MQPKLLRVLQEKELYRIGGKEAIKLDVRFVFATNNDLEQLVKEGRFRSDLLYRINTGKIYIPALRDRKTDIGALALMFLKEISEIRGKRFREISTEAIRYLESYDWKGNVRELRSVIERAILLNEGEILESHHLMLNCNTEDIKGNGSRVINLNLPETIFPLEDIEYEVCRKILDRFNGNISQAARYLNISWRRLKRIAKI